MQLKITLTPYRQTTYTASKYDWKKFVRELARSHAYEMDMYLIESHINFEDVAMSDEISIDGEGIVLDRYLMMDIFESIEDREMGQW